MKVKVSTPLAAQPGNWQPAYRTGRQVTDNGTTPAHPLLNNSHMEKITNSNLKWVERVSRLMDEQFRLPGTNFRFGLDPILNMIPVAGGIGGFAVSAVLLLTMAKYGVSRKVLLIMTLNIILDSTIGAIPIIGNIFDFAYKSNSRNIKLLKEHYQEGKHQGSGKGIIAWIIIILLLASVLVVYVLWSVLSWLIDLI